MLNITDLLATISKAPEDIQQQVNIFSELTSIKQRKALKKSIDHLEEILISLDPVLEVILVLTNSEPRLGLLRSCTISAFAELKRSQKLVKMARLNLEPIAVPSAVPGMFKPAIQTAMEPAEERAIGSSLLTIASDLVALFIHVQEVAYQLKIAVDAGTIGTK